MATRSWACKVSWAEQPNQGDVTGRASWRNNRRYTKIGGGCAAATARVYCGGETSWWNAALHIATTQAAWGTHTCAGRRTFTSDRWSMWERSIWAWSCASYWVQARHKSGETAGAWFYCWFISCPRYGKIGIGSTEVES